MIAVSLVLMQPSTVTALKLPPAACLNTTLRTSGSISASVITKASIVAMCGSIIPAPLAMPHSVTSFDPINPFRETILGKRSVVMIPASAAGMPSSWSPATNPFTPSTIFPRGSR